MQPILTLQLRGVEGLTGTIKRRIQRLESFATPLTAIAQDFYAVEREWFRSRGGGRWVPLRPSYAAWKRRSYPGRPIMRLTDRMWGEFTGRTKHYRINRGTLVIQVQGAPYWKKHHRGGRGTRGWIPRRPLLADSITRRRMRTRRWHNIVTEWLTAKLNVTPQKLIALSGKKGW